MITEVQSLIMENIDYSTKTPYLISARPSDGVIEKYFDGSVTDTGFELEFAIKESKSYFSDVYFGLSSREIELEKLVEPHFFYWVGKECPPRSTEFEKQVISLESDNSEMGYAITAQIVWASALLAAYRDKKIFEDGSLSKTLGLVFAPALIATSVKTFNYFFYGTPDEIIKQEFWTCLVNHELTSGQEI